MEPSLSNMKHCSKCGEALPLENYHRSSRSPDGVSTVCAACTAEYRRRLYEENPEPSRERNRRYYWENRDSILDRRQQYYWDNREYINRRARRVDKQKNDNTALTAARNGKPWTQAEDDILAADDGRTLFAKAILLGRTYRSCASRRSKLAAVAAPARD